MKYIITESQYNLLVEQIVGLEGLLDRMKQEYPQIRPQDVEMVEKFITDSNVGRILVEPIKMGDGLSLSDRVIINPSVFKYPLPKALYIIFHEIAHQYQFKKYGADKMYECYTGDLSDEEAADLIKRVEEVADEFALKKVRQLINLGFPIDKTEFTNVKSMYKITPSSRFIPLIQNVKKMIKEQNITNPEDISEMFYNWVKINL